MKKIATLILSIIFFVCTLVGCLSKDTQTNGSNVTDTTQNKITFTDDLGRNLTIEQPKRVVTLISSFADIWYLAGGVDQIVATTNATWTYFDFAT